MAGEAPDAMAALATAQNNFDASSKTASAVVQPWTPELVQFLALAVLGFSCLALLVSAALLWRAQASPSQVLRTTGVTCILGFSALLLVVGFDNQQLTPIVGLFGAIAGYLLGRESRDPAVDAAFTQAQSPPVAPPATAPPAPAAAGRDSR
jgi:hypothetical protein